MKFLFIHQNFPGQFQHLVPQLVREGHEVLGLKIGQPGEYVGHGVKVVNYAVSGGNGTNVHPWVSDFETKIIRAEACFEACMKIKKQGYKPDVIVAHPGWGESIFVKDVWPDVPVGIYCEFFYKKDGADVGFDKEFSPKDLDRDACRLRLKNINNFLHFDIADFGLSPTQWQASTFPEPFRSKITVIHDGIDTDSLKPNKNVTLRIKTKPGQEVTLSNEHEIITFVNRNFEPYRGYHIFMRSLPKLLRQRPNLRVVLIGSNSVSYGPSPDMKEYGYESWREVFANEIKDLISPKDRERIHFLGHLPYKKYVQAMQVSSVHVYLTYPFVLSWSLLEAMSIGCAIVGSDTKPVSEVISDYENGLLVNFFDAESITEKIIELLDNRQLNRSVCEKARSFCIENFDLNRVCLPRQVSLLTSF